MFSGRIQLESLVAWEPYGSADISQWMIQFPLAYVLSRHTALQGAGIYWSFPVTNIAVAVISVLWFAQGGWKTTRLTDEDRQVIKVAEETIAEEGIV
jgi:hypothetical protein